MKKIDVPWIDFAEEWSAAEDALSRLDQAVLPSPLREGWTARAQVHEAVVSAGLDSLFVDYDSLVTFMADASGELPTDAMRHALDIHRAATTLPRFGAAAVFAAQPIFDLHGRTRTTETGERKARGQVLTDIFGDDPLRDPDALVEEWLDGMKRVEALPALVGAGLLLQDWHRLAPFRNGGPTGRLLVPAYLHSRKRTLGLVGYLSPGFRGHMLEYRPDKASGAWLKAFMAAMARSSFAGLSRLGDLTTAQERLMRLCQGKSRNSRLASVIDVLLARPSASAGDIARGLAMTRRGATLLLDEIRASGAVTEISGREAFRVYRVV